MFSMPKMCGEWGALGCCSSLLVGRIFAEVEVEFKMRFCFGTRSRDYKMIDRTLKSSTLQSDPSTFNDSYLASAMLLSYIFGALETTL